VSKHWKEHGFSTEHLAAQVLSFDDDIRECEISPAFSATRKYPSITKLATLDRD
jgi:hypothetical protein